MTRNGFGQVEANQLSAQKTGQIYASLPLDTNVNVLQNGEFMYYDYKAGKVSATDSTGAAVEPFMVFNEVKLYEPQWRTTYKDFAMIRVGDNYVTSGLAAAAYGDGATTTGVNANPPHFEYGYRMDGIAPRMIKTNVGDIMTTNMVAVEDNSGNEINYSVGDILVPTLNSASHTLQLNKKPGTGYTGTMQWVVVKVYTMPDGQDGLKLQRIA